MSIRAVFGTDALKNAIHVSRDAASYQREIDIYFNDKLIKDTGAYPAVLNNCTLCLIKPHVIQSGSAGKLIDRILDEGFEISAL
jgi:nucleoside-diphosphate kinase